MDDTREARWLAWAKELQFLAQAGLTYTKDPFDAERFQRIRDIAAEMVSAGSALPLETVKGLFCNEEGFQTPKIDTRAALFDEAGRILLVHENDGRWSLPGGWCDVLQKRRAERGQGSPRGGGAGLRGGATGGAPRLEPP